MLQQILRDMYVDPELLAELDEEQKQILFCKIRQEQVRRWKETEETLEVEQKKISNNQVRQTRIKFLEGKDGKPWVWVMGDHQNDKEIDEILKEEVREKARKQADQEAELLRKQNEEAMSRLQEAQAALNIANSEPRVVTSTVARHTSPLETLPVLPVQMRRDNNTNVDSPTADIEHLKEIRSSQILESLEVARQKSHEEAEKEVKSMFTLWQEQEKKAKEAESLKRLIAKKAREDNARAIRKMKTESQIIGVLTATNRDIAGSFNKPIPGGTVCPQGRRPRPTNKEEATAWYKELEEPRGVGINKTTKIPVDYFYGLISRQEAEQYLAESAVGTFLVRLSDRVWGYALSYRAKECCKHYLIDASDGRYRFFGSNQIVHVSLDDLVEYHKTMPFSIVGKEILLRALSRDPPSRTDIDLTDLQEAPNLIPEIQITYL